MCTKAVIDVYKRQFYGEEEINAALQAEQPQSIVPERDESGHGTFLAGVACGSADTGAEFSGAAPLAHIAVVKCKQAKQLSLIHILEKALAANDGKEYDVSICCVNVNNCEMSAILPVHDGGICLLYTSSF